MTPDEDGVELMRIARMAAGAYVKTHPQTAAQIEELIGDATVGAVAAYQRFTPDSGASLATFAYKRAAGAVIDGLRDRSLVTRHEMRKGVRLADLPVHRQAPGSWEALSEETHLQPIDPSRGPSEVAEVAEEFRQLLEAVNALSDRHRQVIVGSFFQERKLQDIAADLGVTPAQVTQDRKRALALLRCALGAAWYGLPVQLHGGFRARAEQVAYLERARAAGVAA